VPIRFCAFANCARISASVIWVGTELLLYVEFANTGLPKKGCTNEFGFEISRTVFPSSLGVQLGQFVVSVTTERGVPSLFSILMVTGITGALKTVVTLLRGAVPTMLYFQMSRVVPSRYIPSSSKLPRKLVTLSTHARREDWGLHEVEGVAVTLGERLAAFANFCAPCGPPGAG